MSKNIRPSLKNAAVILLSFISFSQAFAQQAKRIQPKWLFGESGAANFNTYRGTTQMLTRTFSVPTAFHKGNAVKPYASVLAEYHATKVWGGMLNVAYDNRGGKFDQVTTPCNCPADLETNLSYVAIEPSVRIAPFSNAFYVFAGPTIGINIRKKYTYDQEKQVQRTGELSDVRKTVVSAQAGLGIDIPMSSASNTTQFYLSPFASFQSDLGQSPRTSQSLAIYTIRTGVMLKFGMLKSTKAITVPLPETVATTSVAPVPVQFSVRAPKAVPLNRQVTETFPLRNSVFFDMGSVAIPNRYIALTPSQATSFKEEQLQKDQPMNLNGGRSERQLAVYHNILNIVGDRLRANPNSTILLTGAADKNAAEGKVLAENVKQYLVSIFGINPSRITTEGREKPLVPSEQPGAVKELDLLKEGDRRVDIVSTSPELLMQVGGGMTGFMRPVQIKAVQKDPLDSHVIFDNEGASANLKSWKVEMTDEKGMMQTFGPYKTDHASIPGATILGSETQGNYKIKMIGESNTGDIITRESSVSLVKAVTPKQEGLRYSILFDFDRSDAVAAYEKFLSDVVAPLVPSNATVIIHGHTDIIGEEAYNLSLSHDRAMVTQRILSAAISKAGKKNVQYRSFGYGEDEGMAPFENKLVEERFYNRSVIIDIVPSD